VAAGSGRGGRGGERPPPGGEPRRGPAAVSLRAPGSSGDPRWRAVREGSALQTVLPGSLLCLSASGVGLSVNLVCSRCLDSRRHKYERCSCGGGRIFGASSRSLPAEKPVLGGGCSGFYTCGFFSVKLEESVSTKVTLLTASWVMPV